MVEGNMWCREVGLQRWHFVRASAARGACGRAVNGHLWRSAPGPNDQCCRTCVRIAGAAGPAAMKLAAAAEIVELSDGSTVAIEAVRQ